MQRDNICLLRHHNCWGAVTLLKVKLWKWQEPSYLKGFTPESQQERLPTRHLPLLHCMRMLLETFFFSQSTC